jgi:aryl-alcohol dehydrogenase-like predicted oxidoreductase
VEYRALGRSGLRVSALTMGTMTFGAKTSEQLADNLSAAELVLTADERDRLDKASAPPLIYPYWHQANTARDRLSPADLTLLGPHL